MNMAALLEAIKRLLKVSDHEEQSSLVWGDRDWDVRREPDEGNQEFISRPVISLRWSTVVAASGYGMLQRPVTEIFGLQTVPPKSGSEPVYEGSGLESHGWNIWKDLKETFQSDLMELRCSAMDAELSSRHRDRGSECRSLKVGPAANTGSTKYWAKGLNIYLFSIHLQQFYINFPPQCPWWDWVCRL